MIFKNKATQIGKINEQNRDIKKTILRLPLGEEFKIVIKNKVIILKKTFEETTAPIDNRTFKVVEELKKN